MRTKYQKLWTIICNQFERITRYFVVSVLIPITKFEKYHSQTWRRTFPSSINVHFRHTSVRHYYTRKPRGRNLLSSADLCNSKFFRRIVTFRQKNTYAIFAVRKNDGNKTSWDSWTGVIRRNSCPWHGRKANQTRVLCRKRQRVGQILTLARFSPSESAEPASISSRIYHRIYGRGLRKGMSPNVRGTTATIDLGIGFLHVRSSVLEELTPLRSGSLVMNRFEIRMDWFIRLIMRMNESINYLSNEWINRINHQNQSSKSNIRIEQVYLL